MSAPEFDGMPMTKREVLIARRAFESGAAFGNAEWPLTDSDMQEEATRRYPLPKVTRPRVVKDPMGATNEHGQPVLWKAIEWGVPGDSRYAVVCSWNDGAWFDGYAPHRGHSLVATKERVALWADLLAKPTEEVEDDA